MSGWLDRLAICLLLALAGLSATFAGLHAAGFFHHPRWYGVTQLPHFVLPLLLLWAFSAMPQSPVRAGGVALACGLALAVMWVFLPQVSVVVLAVTVYGLYRAYRLHQEKRRQTAA